MSNDVRDLIEEECLLLKTMLWEKNAAYGNSALDPLRVFSKADPEEQIRVRLDDKLSRLSRGSAAGEDVEQDLLGYLVLLRVARKMRQRKLVAPAVPEGSVVAPAVPEGSVTWSPSWSILKQ